MTRPQAAEENLSTGQEVVMDLQSRRSLASPFQLLSHWLSRSQSLGPSINPEDTVLATVLATVSRGESPVYACNAKLKEVDLERYNKMSADLGLYLPVKKQTDTLNPNIKQVTPPVMQGVTQCQNAKKNGCMRLLGDSLSNPIQLSYNSTCTAKTVAEYEDLIKGSELPASSQGSDEEQEAFKERDEALRDIYNEYSTCDNQAEMTMDIIGAIDGNPASKLADVDIQELLDMLKDVSPSAHHAVECLMDGSKDNIKLGGTQNVDGEVVGTLTGVLYSEGFDTRGSKIAIVTGFIITTSIATWGAYSGHRAVNESEQQWKYEQGFLSSKYGVRKGCDGLGSCNVSTPQPISGSQTTPPNTAPTPTPAAKPSAGTTTPTPDPFDIPDLPVKPQPDNAHYSPDVDTTSPDKLNQDNNDYHYGEGAAEEICEKVYSNQSSLKSNMSKTATWTQESLEEKVKAEDPLDYTNDAELHGTPDASCSTSTYAEGL